ncbi:MAG: hypothetical protein RLZZ244_994 [Verrucomicrobiota bacterium]
MSVSFLQPWFFAGLVAVGAPLWLHLRRKKPSQPRRFPTLRFLEDPPVVLPNPRRLQEWPLFVLRALALVLAVTAFAWPYFPGADEFMVKESRVYLLDNTLSHQAGGAFERMRERVAAEIRGTGREVQLAVVELGAVPRVLSALGGDKGAAAALVEGLRAGSARGSFLDGLRQSNALLSRALGERRRILFFTDGQANQWTESTGGSAFLKGVELSVFTSEWGVTGNAWVAEPEVQRVVFGEKWVVQLAVKVGRQGRVDRTQVVVSDGGRVVAKRSLDFGQGEDQRVFELQWEADPKEWVRGEVRVETTGDGLAGDDRVYFALEPVREGRVALLTKSAFVRTALSQEVMRGRWNTLVLDPAQLGKAGPLESGAEVLVVDALYLQSLEARTLVGAFLSNGCGVLLLCNKWSPVVAGALRELGLESVAVAGTGEPVPSRVRYVFSQHPVLKPFTGQDYGSLGELVIRRTHALMGRNAVPLMVSDRGEALLLENGGYPGRFFALSFGLERADSNWPLHVSFVPFVDLCLQNARPAGRIPAEAAPGDTVVMKVPEGRGAETLWIAAEGRELSRVPVVGGMARVGMPVEPGCYEVGYGTSPEVVSRVCVNGSPKESILEKGPEAGWIKGSRAEESSLVKGVHAGEGTGGREARESAARKQTWAWMFLLAAAGVLVAESLWLSVRNLWRRRIV